MAKKLENKGKIIFHKDESVVFLEALNKCSTGYVEIKMFEIDEGYLVMLKDEWLRECILDYMNAGENKGKMYL